MGDKLRELESWYVDPRSDAYTYSPAFVAAEGWSSLRTGIYLTQSNPGHDRRVKLLPGLKIQEMGDPQNTREYRKKGFDGVTFKDSEDVMHMLIFDCRNVIKPVGPSKDRREASLKSNLIMRDGPGRSSR